MDDGSPGTPATLTDLGVFGSALMPEVPGRIALLESFACAIIGVLGTSATVTAVLCSFSACPPPSVDSGLQTTPQPDFLFVQLNGLSRVSNHLMRMSAWFLSLCVATLNVVLCNDVHGVSLTFSKQNVHLLCEVVVYKFSEILLGYSEWQVA